MVTHLKPFPLAKREELTSDCKRSYPLLRQQQLGKCHMLFGLIEVVDFSKFVSYAWLVIPVFFIVFPFVFRLVTLL